MFGRESCVHVLDISDACVKAKTVPMQRKWDLSPAVRETSNMALTFFVWGTIFFPPQVHFFNILLSLHILIPLTPLGIGRWESLARWRSQNLIWLYNTNRSHAVTEYDALVESFYKKVPINLSSNKVITHWILLDHVAVFLNMEHLCPVFQNSGC